VLGLSRPEHGLVCTVQGHGRIVIGEVKRGLPDRITWIRDAEPAAIAWLNRMKRPRVSLK
jgi:hypothetical protein